MPYSDKIDIINKKMVMTPFVLEDIELALEEVELAILNYCNLYEIPKALKFVWCNMTIDLLKYNRETNIAPDDVLSSFDPSDVSTIRVGDTSISLGDKYRSNARSRTLTSHQANLDDIVMNYRQQLNQFRRMKM